MATTSLLPQKSWQCPLLKLLLKGHKNMELKKDNSQISGGYEVKNNALFFGSNGYLGSLLHSESTKIVKRTERIVTAIYLVTECIDTTEPLREKIRICALDCVSLSHSLLHNGGVTKFNHEGDFVVALIELRSLVSLGLSVSLVSSMNGTILVSEITGLIQDLETEKLARLGEFGGVRSHMRHKELALTKEMFVVPDVENTDKRSLSHEYKDMSFSKEVEERNNVFNKGHKNTQSAFKGQVAPIQHQERPIQSSKVHNQDFNNSKSDIAIRLGRRNTIIKLIKDLKEVTIKEVSNIVPDVSEKTIQRELLNLVSEGVLKKTGEKRWSKYSLKV